MQKKKNHHHHYQYKISYYYLDREWQFRKTLSKDKRSPTIEVAAKLLKQSYCPGKKKKNYRYRC